MARLGTVLAAIGAVLLFAALHYQPPRFHYDAMLEWNQCEQNIRVVRLNGSGSVSEKCRELGQRSIRGRVLLFGGLALLLGGLAIRKKARKNDRVR